MKTIRTLLAATAIMAVTTSCLKTEDPYNAGFVFQRPQYNITTLFANSTAELITMAGYGNWTLTCETNAKAWCTMGQTQGSANTIYNIPITFAENTTGSGRVARLTFTDDAHPDDGHATIQYYQFATRGDGSMGSAPHVKTISGSDGSLFQFSYDARHRPTSLFITRDGTQLHSLNLSYNDADSIVTISSNDATLMGKFTTGYQAERFTSMTDTVGYYSQYTSYGAVVSANQAFNLEHRHASRNNTYYAYRLGGQSLTPDSLHCADSLRVAYTTATSTQVKRYKLTYSNLDNRYQTVDVNQLVFGAKDCDPYQLLSLFRYARQTSIISKVTGVDDGYSVEAQLNSDRSVHQLTVKTISEGVVLPDSGITYTFEY